MATPRAATRATPAADRPARQAERWLRALGDGRTGVLLLAAVGLANVVAALVPGGAAVLDSRRGAGRGRSTPCGADGRGSAASAVTWRSS